MSKKNDKLMNELENRFSDYKNIQNNINKQKMSYKLLGIKKKVKQPWSNQIDRNEQVIK